MTAGEEVEPITLGAHYQATLISTHTSMLRFWTFCKYRQLNDAYLSYSKDTRNMEHLIQ